MTLLKVEQGHLIRQWQQLETNPSNLHPMFITTATPLSKGECGEGGGSGGGCTGVATSSLLIKDSGHAGELKGGCIVGGSP